MMAATAGHRLTLDPMGKCLNMNIMRYGVRTKNQNLVEDYPVNIPV
jgi:hypothetical protein